VRSLSSLDTLRRSASDALNVTATKSTTGGLTEAASAQRTGAASERGPS
jgi:hypothetical protein